MKKFFSIFAFVLIILAVALQFYASKPSGEDSSEISEEDFSVKRAFAHVENIAQKPHFLGSPNHSKVRNYIVNELQKLGLFVQTQEGFSINKYGIATKPKNIIAKIEGSENGKALLLLSHYDSAMHSSFGASDAASGVATILEGLRAFLASEKTHKNDIIIVFTDAEELGLNGAELFVRDHPWSENVGLTLNFESRGSGGNSFMLLETNGGNQKLIEAFIDANPRYPVTNSLAYSVYKMLPNDTDLTVLREQGNINGFNFAFIDDHFDYHTATDLPENLDKETLAHQGSYLMPLLSFFANENLSSLDADEDYIYFSLTGMGMLSYPFAWIFPLLIFSAVIFIGLLIYGFRKKALISKQVFKGFIPLLLTVVVPAILSFLFWKACLLIYPQYSEMEHGFTYNGYYYIAVAIFLALTIGFFSYRKFSNPETRTNILVAPMFLWWLLCAAAALYLKGASYFIIPFFFGLLQFFLFIRQENTNVLLMAILCLPAIFILMPFVPSFPVALGLKILFVASIMTSFLFLLVLPVFFLLKKFRLLGLVCWITALVLFVVAHFKSDFNEERPKPNSLVYILDTETKSASWNTYDSLLDDWTRNYIDDNKKKVEDESVFTTKYNSGFTFKSVAPVKDMPEPEIFIAREDSSFNDRVLYSVKIVPKREINRIDFFADKEFDFQEFKVNGMEPDSFQYKNDTFHVFKNRIDDNLLTYYAANRDTIRLEIGVKQGENPQITMYETSNDLLENEFFSVPERPVNMIPRPFVVNDAVIVKKTFVLK
ncbi:MAG TPA: M20/M25/M40 family metallo-hydrolase [Salinimicrobium sp.]|nr:M20/M25/M40 family metallo-hydrolase [Salinimicrobium sp.]